VCLLGNQVVYTYDGVTWSTPRTIYHQWDDGHIPKVIANQMLVHPVTGFWILPYWNERPRQVRSNATARSPHRPKEVQESRAVTQHSVGGPPWANKQFHTVNPLSWRPPKCLNPTRNSLSSHWPSKQFGRVRPGDCLISSGGWEGQKAGAVALNLFLNWASRHPCVRSGVHFL